MFKRTGIARLKENSDSDILGSHTSFRSIASKVVENSVKSDLWFSFCSKLYQTQNDVMKFKNSQGVTLGSMVHELYPESSYKVGIFKYLLLDYLCYIESPAVKRDVNSNKGFSNTYDKFLATCNLDVVALWLDIPREQAYATYTRQVEGVIYDSESDLFPYVKLWVDRDGVRKITKPRKQLDLGKVGTRVVPVFALKAGVDILYEKAKSDYIELLFQKDGGQERRISITFNTDLLRAIYNDGNFLREGLESMYDGDFMENPNLARGYIRVFEVGGSIYDSPTRSINYARILGIKRISKDDLDLAYINIDLNSVSEVFVKGINTNYKHIRAIINAMKEMEISGIDAVSEHWSTVEVETWIAGQITLLSTTFLRELALFMLGHPSWFNGYTGKPVEVVSSEMPTSMCIEFDLDFSI